MVLIWLERGILPFVFNTKGTQSNAQLLIYEQNCLVHQIIEEQFFEANRGHDNRKQIIHNVKRYKILLSKSIGYQKCFLKQNKAISILKLKPQATFKQRNAHTLKKTDLPELCLPPSEFDILYCFTNILVPICCREPILFSE